MQRNRIKIRLFLNRFHWSMIKYPYVCMKHLYCFIFQLLNRNSKKKNKKKTRTFLPSSQGNTCHLSSWGSWILDIIDLFMSHIILLIKYRSTTWVVIRVSTENDDVVHTAWRVRINCCSYSEWNGFWYLWLCFANIVARLYRGYRMGIRDAANLVEKDRGWSVVILSLQNRAVRTTTLVVAISFSHFIS